MASYVAPYRGIGQYLPQGLAYSQTAGSMALAQGIQSAGAGLGAGLGKALDYYLKRKEQHEMVDAELGAYLPKYANIQGPSSDPNKYATAGQEQLAQTVGESVYKRLNDNDAPLKDKLAALNALKYADRKEQQAQENAHKNAMAQAALYPQIKDAQEAEAMRMATQGMSALPAYTESTQDIPVTRQFIPDAAAIANYATGVGAPPSVFSDLSQYMPQQAQPPQFMLNQNPQAAQAAPQVANPAWLEWSKNMDAVESQLPMLERKLAQYQAEAKQTAPTDIKKPYFDGVTVRYVNFKETDRDATRRSLEAQRKAEDTAAAIKTLKSKTASEPPKMVTSPDATAPVPQAQQSEPSPMEYKSTQTVTTRTPTLFNDRLAAGLNAVIKGGGKITSDVYKAISESASDASGLEITPLEDGSAVISEGGKYKGTVQGPKMGIEELKYAQGVRILPTTGYVGNAPSVEEAKTFREVAYNTNNALQSLNDLFAIAKTPGKAITPSLRAKAQTIQSMLVGALRVQIVGPGAMTESEQKIIKSIIADPTKIFSLDSSNLMALNTAKDKLANNLQNMAGVMGLQPVSQPARSASGVTVTSIRPK